MSEQIQVDTCKCKCMFCPLEFVSKTLKRRHETSHHKEVDRLTCLACKKECKKYDARVEHERRCMSYSVLENKLSQVQLPDEQTTSVVPTVVPSVSTPKDLPMIPVTSYNPVVQQALQQLPQGSVVNIYTGNNITNNDNSTQKGSTIQHTKNTQNNLSINLQPLKTETFVQTVRDVVLDAVNSQADITTSVIGKRLYNKLHSHFRCVDHSRQIVDWVNANTNDINTDTKGVLLDSLLVGQLDDVIDHTKNLLEDINSDTANIDNRKYYLDLLSDVLRMLRCYYKTIPQHCDIPSICNALTAEVAKRGVKKLDPAQLLHLFHSRWTNLTGMLTDSFVLYPYNIIYQSSTEIGKHLRYVLEQYAITHQVRPAVFDASSSTIALQDNFGDEAKLNCSDFMKLVQASWKIHINGLHIIKNFDQYFHRCDPLSVFNLQLFMTWLTTDEPDTEYQQGIFLSMCMTLITLNAPVQPLLS